MKNEDLSIKEEWKDIKNYEGLYKISNLGRVKKINKKVLGAIYGNIVKYNNSRL